MVSRGSTHIDVNASAAPKIIDAIRIDSQSGEQQGWFAQRFFRRASKTDKVTYTVTDHEIDRRTQERYRQRLRSGKIFDENEFFLSEYILFNRSAEGARLRLTRNVKVPEFFLLYDDTEKTMSRARTVWTGDNQIGMEYCDLAAANAQARGDNFYGIND